MAKKQRQKNKNTFRGKANNNTKIPHSQFHPGKSISLERGQDEKSREEKKGREEQQKGNEQQSRKEQQGNKQEPKTMGRQKIAGKVMANPQKMQDCKKALNNLQELLDTYQGLELHPTTNFKSLVEALFEQHIQTNQEQLN